MTTETSVQPVTRRLLGLGQSLWLDAIQRSMISSGRLREMIEAGWITGMTSNPTIFRKAIANSDDYTSSIAALARQAEMSTYDAFISLAIEDIRGAADALHAVYEASEQQDGFVSLELPPGLEQDTAASIAEAQRLFALVDRPNVMIKVPGTDAGIRAVSGMIFAGVNTNITLIFSVAAYEASAEAYMRGLEERLNAGKSLQGVASVASFFVSRIDTAVDILLPPDSPVAGTAAIANARHAYAKFREMRSSRRWRELQAHGAQVQRPLWASTGTKNARYSDVMYVQELIGPETISTVPEATLAAVLDHLEARPTLEPNLEKAERQLRALREADVDLDAVTAALLTEGLATFAEDFRILLDTVAGRMAAARSAAQ
jgi:transaldolase